MATVLKGIKLRLYPNKQQELDKCVAHRLPILYNVA